eukprot:3591772-Alexandrium_andersonii.AAC.1
MAGAAGAGSAASLPRGVGGLPTAASGPCWLPAVMSRRRRVSPGSLAVASVAPRPPGVPPSARPTRASAASAGARMRPPAS